MVGSRDLANWEQLGGLERGMGRGGEFFLQGIDLYLQAISYTLPTEHSSHTDLHSLALRTARRWQLHVDGTSSEALNNSSKYVKSKM